MNIQYNHILILQNQITSLQTTVVDTHKRLQTLETQYKNLLEKLQEVESKTQVLMPPQISTPLPTEGSIISLPPGTIETTIEDSVLYTHTPASSSI